MSLASKTRSVSTEPVHPTPVSKQLVRKDAIVTQQQALVCTTPVPTSPVRHPHNTVPMVLVMHTNAPHLVRKALCVTRVLVEPTIVTPMAAPADNTVQLELARSTHVTTSLVPAVNSAVPEAATRAVQVSNALPVSAVRMAPVPKTHATKSNVRKVKFVLLETV